MGMSPEQYWDGPPSLAVAYRKAWRLEKQSENEQAWLQGLYVFAAFQIGLANAFSKRGAKKQNYIEKPFDLFPLTEAEKARREAEENAKMQHAMEAMIRAQRAKKKGD